MRNFKNDYVIVMTWVRRKKMTVSLLLFYSRTTCYTVRRLVYRGNTELPPVVAIHAYGVLLPFKVVPNSTSPYVYFSLLNSSLSGVSGRVRCGYALRSPSPGPGEAGRRSQTR
jgi:hypothetical protein